MFSWLTKDSNKQKIYENVVDGLKQAYKQKLLPLEKFYNFHEFYSPPLDDTDFEAKPMIMLVGQYSTGKTTFIKYLLDQDFPGMRIGPEPTTDRFICIMYGDRECTIPGNALAVDAEKQFRPLSKFGNAFLNRLECSTLPSAILKNLTFIDTPGILSGEKQRVDRGYDFTGVLEWFAERVDRIILLFDAHKLDISDEFRRSIEALRGHDDKIRIILNKADMVDQQQLMRIYGALMWSLGKVLQTPEVARVYIGSFWDQPLRYEQNKTLFEDEQQDLFKDLSSLPVNAALRKLNDLIKRARLAKVHSHIIAELRADMPRVFGKDGRKKELIRNLDTIYDRISTREKFSMSDFPNKDKMQEILKNYDFTKFNSLNKRLLDNVDLMLKEISKLSSEIPTETNQIEKTPEVHTSGLLFNSNTTPFGHKVGEGINEGIQDSEWIVFKYKDEYDKTFSSLPQVNGKVTGIVAKEQMVKSKLPNAVLSKIWNLSDIDKDGYLDSDEFALAMHLIKVKLNGYDLPTDLPEHLIPPKYRLDDGIDICREVESEVEDVN